MVVVLKEDEPRMNTNRHEDRWTSFNDKRHPNASALLLLWYHFASSVDNLFDFGCHPPMNNASIRSLVFIGVHSWFAVLLCRYPLLVFCG